MGSIIYQILVDRFAPSTRLSQKLPLYSSPRQLLPWSQPPMSGTFNSEVSYWSHELDFYGGDFLSLTEKIPYLQHIGVDVIYLNPIFSSMSNHKYDATDYFEIAPEFGSKEEFQNLVDSLHQAGFKLILDGVFNHVGRNHSLFLKAKEDPMYREYFDFHDKYPQGVRLWADAPSLPELNLESKNVRDMLYLQEDSVVQHYLKLGIDGWRLDVAFDIGFQYLQEMTKTAHEVKPHAVIIGEIWNYPKEWLEVIDGVMNFTLREWIYQFLQSKTSIHLAKNQLQFLLQTCDYEGLLRSWSVLDNHDVPRLGSVFLDEKMQRLARILQFFLPGCPNVYYGSELGMIGGVDPQNRAPMEWEKVSDTNPTLMFMKQLIDLHHEHIELSIGDTLVLETEQLLCFERFTNLVTDSSLIILNRQPKTHRECILIPNSKWMNYSKFHILLGEGTIHSFVAGFLDVEMPPCSYLIVKPNTQAEQSYTPYKRV